MNTTSLVQASADIVTITTLRPGDVFKRLNDTYGTHQLVIGIVQDVMNNGTNAVITALEFGDTYGTAEVKLVTFGSGADLKLFPASPIEVTERLAEIEAAADRAVHTAATMLGKAQETHRLINRTIAQLSDKPLTAAPTRVGQAAIQGAQEL